MLRRLCMRLITGITLTCLCISGISSAVVYNCTGKTNGVYEAGCQSFVSCTEGIASYTECHIPKVVNEETGKCDNPLNVNSPCGVFRDCSFRDDGSYADLDYQCHWYYTCTYGIFYGHHKCAQGLVWNDKLQTCDYKYNVSPPCGTKAT